MNRSGIDRRILALLLCAALLCAGPLPAFAEETPADGGGLLDEAALTDMVESFLLERGIPKDRVGIGFCIPETGEEWFYNPDAWFYPASVYKVPLMMILAEHVSGGQVDPEEQIGGLPLSTVFEYILTNSNNDYAHMVRQFLGGDEVWRQEAKQYAGLPDEYYDPDYMDYCYFSPRFITRVMETLYADPDRFPHVLECLLKADQAHYFRLADEMHPYAIAQKYGSYSDMQGTDWNHTTGIVYTTHPFILTVMTRNVVSYEWVLGHFALLFKDYALSLEEEVAPYVAEQEALAQERAEAERVQAEAEAERQRAETERIAEEREAQIRRLREEREQQDRAAKLLMYSLAATGAALVALGIPGAILGLIDRSKRRRRYKAYLRRQEEARREARGKRGGRGRT